MGKSVGLNMRKTTIFGTRIDADSCKDSQTKHKHKDTMESNQSWYQILILTYYLTVLLDNNKLFQVKTSRIMSIQSKIYL